MPEPPQLVPFVVGNRQSTTKTVWRGSGGQQKMLTSPHQLIVRHLFTKTEEQKTHNEAVLKKRIRHYAACTAGAGDRDGKINKLLQ